MKVDLVSFPQDVAYRLGEVKNGVRAEGCVGFPVAPELGPLDGKLNRTNSLDGQDVAEDRLNCLVVIAEPRAALGDAAVVLADGRGACAGERQL